MRLTKKQKELRGAGWAVHMDWVVAMMTTNGSTGEGQDSLQCVYVELFGRVKYFVFMSMTVEQIAEEALSLPNEARALLADRLVDSLDPVKKDPIQQLWAAEALRRRDDVRSGRIKTIPSDEALARVRRAVAR